MNRVSSISVAVAALAVASLAGGGCSGSDGEPGLERIDGPAQVDPDAEVGGLSDDSDG